MREVQRRQVFDVPEPAPIKITKYAARDAVFVHPAVTEHLTALHTGDRSAKTIDAGDVLPHLSGVPVRDGYAGYPTWSTSCTPGAELTCSAIFGVSTRAIPRASCGPGPWPMPPVTDFATPLG